MLNPIIESHNRPLMMGILNVTPDSFSDGGEYAETAKAVAHAKEMLADGADIIDIGGESTRPGSESVSAQEQIKRVVPVISELYAETKCCISVDTTLSQVAHEAIQAGASIINDISAFEDDDKMADVAAATGCYAILMHKKGRPADMQDNPNYEDAVDEIYQYLRDRVDYAVSRGVKRENLIVDPGIGFGKTVDHNLCLVQNIGKFHRLGLPVLLGASRKSFIGKILDIDTPAERVFGDAAVTAYACREGVQIFRVHDVRACKQVIQMTQAITKVNLKSE